MEGRRHHAEPRKGKRSSPTSLESFAPAGYHPPAQIERAAAESIRRGGVDVVFNNAGYGMAGPLEGMSDEQILRMVNTNLIGAIRTTKAFIPHFRERRAGLFINTTSIGGLITVPFNSIWPPRIAGPRGLEREHGLRASQLGIGMKTVSRAE
jgi:NAD(P)-dependent dehydrogenase (short-subunit alcohol dehydrogenase family)